VNDEQRLVRDEEGQPVEVVERKRAEEAAAAARDRAPNTWSPARLP
jgi:adenylate cyclase